MQRTFLVVSCVNSDEILEDNLLLSPDVRSGALSCRALRNTRSAASAYAAALADTDADILIFLHQDVYLPEGWLDRLRDSIAALDRDDPAWGVIGSYGATATGQHVGYVYDACNARLLGTPVDTPVHVAILDEIVIIVRRDSGVTFDPGLPGYHMYGTQIGLAASDLDRTVYVANLPVVHNSKSIVTLDASFEKAWHYITKKWRKDLPIPNLMCGFLDGTTFPLWKWRLRNRVALMRRKRKLYSRLPDVRQVAKESGLE